MNHGSVNDGATIYTRITKQTARRVFESGGVFYIIARKMRPGMPFSLGMVIDGAHYARENAERVKYPGLPLETFEKVIRDFCWYNANCHETGTYAAFYTMKDVKAK